MNKIFSIEAVKISRKQIYLICFRWAILMMGAFMVVHGNSQGNAWQNLIRHNLDNWERLNGHAVFQIVEDSIIAGTSTANSPNSFLATKQNYSDFILEFEVRLDNDLNSGVQVRSLSLPKYQKGRVHGYQIEIDPSDRAFSGGIYDEARRGWMYPLSRNLKGRQAFKPGSWNHYRVEAIGSTLSVWVNGIMTAKLVDDMTGSGFIALQVHSINRKEQEGKQILWKNLRIKTSGLDEERWEADPDVAEIGFLVNQLTDYEIRKGWRLLWDGKTLNGWMTPKSSSSDGPSWEINEGVLTVPGTAGIHGGGPGGLITEDQFCNFELELEVMVTKGANSGIKYFVQTSSISKGGTAIGCEYQIIDDALHPDAKLGIAGNRAMASLYDLIPADNPLVLGRGKQFKGVGEWNQLRIVSKDGRVEHWLNNEKTLEYDRDSQTFKALVAYSKYRNYEGFGTWPQGHILLQDHGNEVHFRNIKIREL